MKAASAIAVLFVLFSGVVWGATSQGLPFINDDYPRALNEAKQHHQPVFVEVWAPW